jgi:transglutaminase-like putative cysteine protease
MLGALFLFAFRYRFLIFTTLLAVGAWFINTTIASGKLGEFDAFFWSVKFNTGASLFILGWLTGYGFSRARFFSVFWSVALLAVMVVVVARVAPMKKDTIIMAFAPLLAYAFYIIYTSEFVRNLNDDEPGFLWMVLKRLTGFALVVFLLLFGLLWVFNKDFEAIEKEWGGGGAPKEGNQQGGSNMTRNDGMGTNNNNSMGLGGLNNRANKDSVLFVAKLDNFFPDGKTPNPLYFISDYFTKFDNETQTFEIDTLRPYNDLFSPDVSKIPLFFTKQDTSVLRKAMSSKNKRIATLEVYKHNLSAKLLTAPATAFFVQPIAVPEENKYIYRSGYRAKMEVSDLNSAYFVYNPAGDKMLEQFQAQRFEALRKASDYKGMPADFMAYYTQMPRGAEYDSITKLARNIVTQAKAKTPVDQVIAIRDFFMAADENGQPTFRYSDNPGVPGMPSANKLTYFLFDNKKGYCAYFAGATLFLLRSLGLPSRVATGFLTVDRSSKNPGWFWFYEDQAHAWVQVYFPGYGWIDFDTTVPSTEQQESPQPDQTPPLTSQVAWLVANGKATAVDTLAKRVTMQVEKMLYWDDPYELKPAQPLLMDVSLARVTRDTGQVPLSQLAKGDEMVAVSYSEQFKTIVPEETDSGLSIMKRFPNPAPIDEIKIMPKDEEQKAQFEKKKDDTPVNWKGIFLTTLLILALLAILLFALPWLIWQYLHMRARSAKGTYQQQAYRRFYAMMYYLNQLGYTRGGGTALQFARSQVDSRFGTSMASFMQVYQKVKYSQQPLTLQDQIAISEVYGSVISKVRAAHPWKYRAAHFINFNRTVGFFIKPSLYS